LIAGGESAIRRRAAPRCAYGRATVD
jgi:hypothetical protein